jgi:hydrogenase expression/formation protein HypC
MCLAIPMRIKKIEGSFAVVEAANLTRRINIEMLPGAKAGEYVMVHAGFAIEKVDRTAAEETLKVIDEICR